MKAVIKNAQNEVLAEREDALEINLVYSAAYAEGDHIEVSFDDVNTFYHIQMDDALGDSLNYITGNIDYVIPFGDKRFSVKPKAFSGEKHMIHIRKAYDFEKDAYRNLAVNFSDQHDLKNMYPHASANVETRNEAVFYALNAIDGCTATQSHGKWPFQTWGVNQDPEALLTLNFGRKVKIDRLAVYNRADFPHDCYWEQAKVTFSDGTSQVLHFTKTGNAQMFEVGTHEIEWLTFGDCVNVEDPSPFAALTQIEVYGVQ